MRDLRHVWWEDARLVVRAPPDQQLFVMKLFAARERDRDDLVVLWPRCGFRSTAEVVHLLHDAYPHEDVDPHLESFVRAIERAAEAP